jgi:hypothetical protein
MATVAVSLVALLALPVAVLATTTEAIAQTGGMTATLPMLGSSMTVTVTLDGTGNLSQVTLDPVGTYSASKVSGHSVTFDQAGGTSQVKIKAKGDKLSIKASAGSLDALVGSGTWSADVFGTGEKSSVAYSIGKALDGSPVLALDSVNGAAGITVEPGTPKTKTGEHGSSASVKVVFNRDGYTKTLSISVSVKATGDRPASLQIKLSGKDRQKLSGPLADLIGTRTWSGKACDGTPVGITYAVLADGTVAYGAATGDTATVKSGEHGFTVRFDATHVRVSVNLKANEDGTYSLKVSSKRGECSHQVAPLPVVNTPVLPGADQPGNHDKADDTAHDKAKDSSKTGRSGGHH